MKKLLISILLLVAMCFNFVACDTPTNSGTTGGTKLNGDYDGSEVTITFSHTMGANLREVLDRYITEFNQLYPNIHVEHDQVGGYDDVRDTIKTQITVGAQPNIAYCYPDHVALYNVSKAVLTLDDFISSTTVQERADGTTEIIGLTAEQKEDFIQGYYEEGMQFGDGKMYSMPFSKSTEVLYYNKTFFDANNIEVPTTWDELEEVCAKIKSIKANSVPLGYDSESNWFITMCEQLGSDYTSATGNNFIFDNETNREFVKKFAEWYQKGYVTTQEISGAYTSALFVQDEGTDMKSYMSIGSSAGATHQRPDAVDGEYPFEVGITSIPQEDEDNPKVISQGPSVCIFKKANHMEEVASWLFVKYLTTTPEFQAAFSMESGYVPVIKSVENVDVYKEFLASADGGDFIAALSAKVCLEQEAAYYTSPAFVGSSDARDQVGLIIQTVFVTDPSADLDAAIDAAFKKAIEECKYAIGA